MLNQPILSELQHEAAQTKKMLEKVPYDQFDWNPHQKSMNLGRLAAHVAELPGWITMIVTTDELDFSKFDYKPYKAKSTEDLAQFFNQNVQQALEALQGASDETLLAPWTLRNGEHIIFTLPRIAAIRSMAMNHLIHHRGQLSVFLRLLDIPIPGMYGPSADEMS
jgi:uncharacterized damage-inducible protein DinB